jgi:hypothetical protein
VLGVGCDGPGDLRACVEHEIQGEIGPKAWARCRTINEAEQESLRDVLNAWKGGSHEAE